MGYLTNLLFIRIWILPILIIQILFAQNKVLNSTNEESKKMKRSDSEWKRILSSSEYHILREKGTERAFTGEYDGHFEEGTYVCAGCGTVSYTHLTLPTILLV